MTTLSTQSPLFLTKVTKLIRKGLWPEYMPLVTQKNFGYWAGGLAPSLPESPTSNISRTEFATDTSTAINRSVLSLRRFGPGSHQNSSYGWFAGGATPFLGNDQTSIIDRLDFAVDTNSAIFRSNLSQNTRLLSGNGNDSFAWWAGGLDSTSSPSFINLVSRTNLSSDTNNAINRGPLSIARNSLASASNDNFSWWGGGITQVSVTNRVDRTQFSNDSVTTLVRGDLLTSRQTLSGASTSDNGYWAGGTNPSVPGINLNVVERTSFVSDTSTAIDRSDLSLARGGHSAASNTSFVWWSGGASTNRIDRTDLANDTINANVRGDLAFIRIRHSGVSG